VLLKERIRIEEVSRVPIGALSHLGGLLAPRCGELSYMRNHSYLPPEKLLCAAARTTPSPVSIRGKSQVVFVWTCWFFAWPRDRARDSR
jgi:hypothetical protein